MFKYTALLLSAALMLAFTGAARASLTFADVWDTNVEDDVVEILDSYFGHSITWSQIDDPAYGRVPDNCDAIWLDGETDVTFTAVWWDGAPGTTPNHKFGYRKGGTDNELFQTSSMSMGDSVGVSLGLGELRWYADNTAAHMAYSDPVLNTVPLNDGTYDRMVTFKLGEGDYALFFDTGTDRDFQDLVVRAQGETLRPKCPVSEPGTLLLLGTGLMGLAGYGFKRGKRK